VPPTNRRPGTERNKPWDSSTNFPACSANGGNNGNGQGGQPFGGSPAGQQWGHTVSQTPLDQLAGVFGHTARNMDPNQYRDHVTPGVGGTNPLGGLKGPALALVGGLLLKHMMGNRGGSGAGGLGGMLGSVLGGQAGMGGQPGGGLGNLMGGGGGPLGGLLGRIPGLTTSDPNQMDPSQVASLADFARQNDPDAFGRAMAEPGTRTPASCTTCSATMACRWPPSTCRAGPTNPRGDGRVSATVSETLRVART
jgi:hypothetical protein